MVDLRVYAIWVPMLPTDERSQWEEELLNDPRVTHLWDQERAVGAWFANPDNLGLQYPGPIMWDAFLLFGREARWDNAPSNLLASGWTVIGNTEQLETSLDAHLAEAGTPIPATATPGTSLLAAGGVITVNPIRLTDASGLAVSPAKDVSTALAG